MKTGTSAVKSAKAIVGQVSFPVYDTLDEAVGAEGAETVLSLFNTQNATNTKNEFRKQFNTKPSKSSFRDQAMMALLGDGAALASVQGDEPKYKAWIANKAAELEKAYAASQADKVAAATKAAAEAGITSEGDDEDEES